MRLLPLVCLSSCLALAACLDRGEYPSLRPRAFEIAGRNVPPPPPPPPAVPARPEVVSRAAALLAHGREGQRAFAAELARTGPVVARAGVADSESWIAAQEQLSGLDASRAATATAMAEIDALTLSGVDAHGVRFGEADFAVVRSAGEEVYAMLEAQQREMAELAATLAAP